MAKHGRHPGRGTAGPAVLVASLTGGGKNRKRRSKSRKKGTATALPAASAMAGAVRRVPNDLGRLVAGPLPKGIAKRVPSKRRRKKLVRKLNGNLETISKVASGLGTAIGVLATGAEVLSVLRSQRDGAGEEEQADEPDDEMGEESDEGTDEVRTGDGSEPESGSDEDAEDDDEQEDLRHAS